MTALDLEYFVRIGSLEREKELKYSLRNAPFPQGTD
jgi:hypothetical protein